MVRVAIIDDHESVRLGVSAVCAIAGYEVVHSVSTVDAFVARAAERPVDIVVLDLSLEDGSSITDNVQRSHATGAAVLIHSIADRVASVREAFAAGVAGVIPKASPTEVIVDAIATVAAGGVLNNLEWASAIDADSEFATVQLGRRERDVLHLYASGLPLKQVALELGIAVSTAKEHLGRIRSKYVEVGRPAPTKVDLLRRAVEDGILPELNPGQVDGD
ncbi:response regulator transcription factor [Labedella populi]|uniref:Response regulator transcription factor n=1 Tax=Labedella populi TaxID=2498850 RepID=A0A3S4AVW5_9MICO|nr:response regulator transcription factor [Labedella populi]RWZ68512.1 response regulator transcription factor [Labedella populi]